MGRTGVPLYQQVRAALLERMGRGDYTSGAPFITERKLCEQFGVSSTTAVRVLNELVAEGVLVRRRGKGTFVAEPQSGGSSARARTADGADPVVACILQGHGRHETQILEGLEDASTKLGYRMFLNYTGGDRALQDAALRRSLRSDVQGIVLYPADGPADLELLADARRQQVPIVMIDRYPAEVATDAVIADNVAVGYRVTEELIKLGHERIAAVWNETACSSVRDRLTGHLQALKDHGVPIRPELSLLRPYVRHSTSGPKGTVQNLLALSGPPTILLCSNGYVLAQVAEDLVAVGMSVPGVVDLAGMDDAGPFDILPLTAVAGVLPSRRMGHEAMLRLHARINSPEPYADAQHFILPIDIRTRAAAPGHLSVVVPSRP